MSDFAFILIVIGIGLADAILVRWIEGDWKR